MARVHLLAGAREGNVNEGLAKAKLPEVALAMGLHHGPVVAGSNLSAAQDAIEELEETARVFLMLRRENVRALTPQQVVELRAKFG